MLGVDAGARARRMAIPLLFALYAAIATGQPLDRGADPLLAIDQHRASVIEHVVRAWGTALATSPAQLSIDELRMRLASLRADVLLAASLAGTLDGLQEVIGVDDVPIVTAKPGATHTKALGDVAADVVYTPVTPCRLVETRGMFAAVYQGDGSAAHTPVPFAPTEIRNYAVQGGSGVCLSQLPAGLTPSAVQLQVFGMPTSSVSGDIEILPQGASFGSTATMVYVGTIAFNTVSTAARINLANNQISVQVRGGGAHVAIDVVGYFKSAAQGNAMNVVVNGQRVMRYEYNGTSPNVIGGHPNNSAGAFAAGQTIGGGGDASSNCSDPPAGGTRSCANVTGNSYATIGGGIGNRAGGDISTNGGGAQNTASGDVSTVAGGYSNTANGEFTAVGGGGANVATGYASAIPGGYANIANGSYSVAVGLRAMTSHDRAFVWNGWASGEVAGSFRPNSFQIHGENGLSVEYGSRRSDGGGTSWVLIGSAFPGQAIATSTGGYLGTDGLWHDKSDRDAKENFTPVDAQVVLDRVVALPVTRWNYRVEPASSHIGPVAQDFYATFGVGRDDKTIAPTDAAGIAFAAIQGLHQLVRDKEARITALETTVDDLRQAVEALRANVAR